MAATNFADAVSAFGASVKAKLANVAISGAPEDQLRGPLESLIKDLAATEGMAANTVQFVGETTLSDLKTRPDFAVTVSKALVGFIEVKAPGKGADPRQFDDAHDKDQWSKLKSLPNLIYTDGRSFSLWRVARDRAAAKSGKAARSECRSRASLPTLAGIVLPAEIGLFRRVGFIGECDRPLGHGRNIAKTR